MSAGSAQTLTVTIADSASGNAANAIASPDSPRMLPPGGLWCGRLSQVGQTDWFAFPVRAGHTFTIVTQALNESGLPTETKALPAIGVWDAFKPVSATPLNWAPALNGYATGETWLQVTASADDIVRLGIADMRGDGRPDYAYNGWVALRRHGTTATAARCRRSYRDSRHGFSPFRHRADRRTESYRSPASRRMKSPPLPLPAHREHTGSVDVEVDDLPMFYAMAILPGGISYDCRDRRLAHDQYRSGKHRPHRRTDPLHRHRPRTRPCSRRRCHGHFFRLSGNATLACGAESAPPAATGDGIATMSITAPSTSASVVTASLSNGATLQAHFSGGTTPTLSASLPTLSVAAGATVNWTTQALALATAHPPPVRLCLAIQRGNITVSGLLLSCHEPALTALPTNPSLWDLSRKASKPPQAPA